MTKGNSDVQAVIFCGPGHRLFPLCDDASVPKPLLPVANKPMISYPLSWLANNGITDIIVIAPMRVAPKLSHHLHRAYSDCKIDLVLLDEYDGTFHALEKVRNRLKSDFLLLSCDLITDAPLHQLIDLHRIKNAALTVMLHTPSSSVSEGDVRVGNAQIDDGEAFFAGYDEDAQRLVRFISKGDVEDGKLSIRMSVLTKHPNITVRTDLQDAHVYMCRKDLLDFVFETLNHSFFSIREELIPYLVNAQFRKKYQNSLPDFTCVLYLLDSGFCLRANSVPSYAECNRHAVKSATTRVPVTTELPPKSQIGNDSMIGEHSRIGERTTVKKSVIGNHVNIGCNVKLINCVIMDHVVIEDQCKLDNVIICSKAILREKCSLKDCEVGSQYVVERELAFKGEVLCDTRTVDGLF